MFITLYSGPLIMDYEQLENNVVRLLYNNGSWNRVVSLDIEASLEIFDDPKKTILSISVARRNNSKIEIQNFIIEDETPEEEVKIIKQLGAYCRDIKPLMLIGYGIRGFDLPILLIKTKQLEEYLEPNGYMPEYWALIDTLRRSYILDIINRVKSEIARYTNNRPRRISLDDAINHDRFKHLPFKKTKYIVSDLLSNSNNNKWAAIHKLWKEDRDKFIKYIEGDVHDTLLLAEDLFRIEQ